MTFKGPFQHKQFYDTISSGPRISRHISQQREDHNFPGSPWEIGVSASHRAAESCWRRQQGWRKHFSLKQLLAVGSGSYIFIFNNGFSVAKICLIPIYYFLCSNKLLHESFGAF